MANQNKAATAQVAQAPAAAGVDMAALVAAVMAAMPKPAEAPAKVAVANKALPVTAAAGTNAAVEGLIAAGFTVSGPRPTKNPAYVGYYVNHASGLRGNLLLKI